MLQLQGVRLTRRRALSFAPRPSPFAALFCLAALGLVAAAGLSVSQRPEIAAGSPVFYGLLGVIAVLVVGLGAATGVRIVRKLMGRRFGEPAPRLHIRFLTLFALTAVAPALLMAIVLALFMERGVEFWFGERVNTLVETVADVAREQTQRELNPAQGEMLRIAYDLSQPGAVEGLSSSRIQYNRYLTELAADAYGYMPAAYVIDSQSTVLARADLSDLYPDAPAFTAPSGVMFANVRTNQIAASDPVQRDGATDYVRLLMQMPAYDDAYLYIVWYVDLSLLAAADAATASYRQAIAQEERMRRAFVMIYALAVALILVGALWLALSAATRVVQPVGRLVSAAEKVRHGDLDARVQVMREDDEIAALGRAFNRMTRQLSSQRRALLEANAEAERRRAFIEAVLTGVSAGVIGLDAGGRITLVNRSAAALLEDESEAMVGRPASEAARVFLPVIEEAMRRPGEMAESQIDIASSSGSLVHLSVRAGQDEDGGIVITFDDVTRLVSAQRNAAWRDVARRIAHEIKNPLTPIQLSAERIRRKYRQTIPEDQLEVFDRCVDTIVRQVSDIGRMVDEFSSFARMPTPKMEAADLAEIARAAVFAQRVASPGIRIPLDVPEEPVIVECDSRLATQALANILKNAAESVSTRMDGDGDEARGRIAVRVYADGDFAVVEASDDGLGWPTPDKARLTEPYMTTREKGTGLGLAIVRRVMEDHGGRLELDDPPEGGGAIVRLAFARLEEGSLQRELSASAE